MQDKELHQQILGIASPWTVTEVQLDHEAEEVRVRVKHPRGTTFRCPECDKECPLKTVLIAAPTRVKCPTHGVKNAPLPWAEKGSRFTTPLTPMKKVARTIRERLPTVVSYCTHGITNVVAEGMNSKIMSIKRRVGGYRNPEDCKAAVYFYCGGLDLYPR
ncbi:transposase [Roseimaritima sediminicola]|uniref:transposase n=1 Tax=Roseimaritima sediminicola TaxID=2662066 RepID=UPI0012982CEE|nr:transposase [Roseimaritima sediminicola]